MANHAHKNAAKKLMAENPGMPLTVALRLAAEEHERTITIDPMDGNALKTIGEHLEKSGYEYRRFNIASEQNKSFNSLAGSPALPLNFSLPGGRSITLGYGVEPHALLVGSSETQYTALASVASQLYRAGVTHYLLSGDPAMTERSLATFVERARGREYGDGVQVILVHDYANLTVQGEQAVNHLVRTGRSAGIFLILGASVPADFPGDVRHLASTVHLTPVRFPVAEARCAYDIGLSRPITIGSQQEGRPHLGLVGPKELRVQALERISEQATQRGNELHSLTSEGATANRGVLDEVLATLQQRKQYLVEHDRNNYADMWESQGEGQPTPLAPLLVLAEVEADTDVRTLSVLAQVIREGRALGMFAVFALSANQHPGWMPLGGELADNVQMVQLEDSASTKSEA